MDFFERLQHVLIQNHVEAVEVDFQPSTEVAPNRVLATNGC